MSQSRHSLRVFVDEGRVHHCWVKVVHLPRSTLTIDNICDNYKHNDNDQQDQNKWPGNHEEFDDQANQSLNYGNSRFDSSLYSCLYDLCRSLSYLLCALFDCLANFFPYFIGNLLCTLFGFFFNFTSHLVRRLLGNIPHIIEAVVSHNGITSFLKNLRKDSSSSKSFDFAMCPA